MNQKRRETTTVATTTQLRSETPIAVPAVEFIAAHPVVELDDGDERPCGTCADRPLPGFEPICPECGTAWVSRLAGVVMVLAFVANALGCATVAAPAHPSPRAQAVAKCLAAEDAGQPTPAACKSLAPDVAALRLLSTMAGRS